MPEQKKQAGSPAGPIIGGIVVVAFIAIAVTVGGSSGSAGSSDVPAVVIPSPVAPNWDSAVAAIPVDSLGKYPVERVLALYDQLEGVGVPSAAVSAWQAAAKPIVEKERQRQEKAAEARRLAEKWYYRSDTDPMTSRTSHSASIESENTVNFDFPYEGTQHGTLMLRNHPSYGHDVIFSIQKGQILCQSYEDCTIHIRFDDHEPRSWSAIGPSDNSSDVIFLRDYNDFVRRLRKAKVVRIQVPIYQEGSPTFEFEVGGFSTERYSGK